MCSKKSFGKIWLWKWLKQIKYLNLFAFSAYQESNEMNKIIDCLMSATSKSRTPLIQTLIKTVISVKDELKYRDLSILIANLTLLLNHNSNSDAMNNFRAFKNELFSSSKNAIDWHLDGKMKQVQLTKYEFEYRGKSRPIALFGICAPPGLHWMAEN